MENIYVTKPFLPPLAEYERYLDKIWKSDQLTNQGSLVLELEKELHTYLGLPKESAIQFLTNGTLSLQLALRTLNAPGGEIITTPFTYVATTTSILWEYYKPVFVDINPNNFCIDAKKIEAAITKNTKAIMAVHVFGYACDVDKIEQLAKKYNIKVIYDGAHAFGSRYHGQSLLSYGDITMCSFHATKLFHTIEGGCLITRDKATSDQIELMKRFGHNNDDYYTVGINAKASEFQAAMGLCNLNYIDKIISARKNSSALYDRLLHNAFQRPQPNLELEYNYNYYPIVFESEKDLLQAKKKLEQQAIYARRYFYPSLNKLPYIKNYQTCPISEDIAVRVLCLPLYYDINDETIRRVCKVLIND